MLDRTHLLMPHPAALARCQPDLRRIQQLVEGGVPQLHLGFDTLASQLVAEGPFLDGVVKKRRLADSGLTAQNEQPLCASAALAIKLSIRAHSASLPYSTQSMLWAVRDVTSSDPAEPEAANGPSW